MDELQVLKDIWGEIDKQDPDVKIKLIAFITKATGLIFGGRVKESNKREAEKFLIEEIKNNEKMPPLLKAASISNSRKILKEYNNQNEIVNMAFDYLSDNAEPEKIDADWLNYFFDNAKNIEAEEIKIIWAKILSKKCENNELMSKRLIYILSTISTFEAEVFFNLAKFCYNIKNDDDISYYLLYDLHTDIELHNKEGAEAYKILYLLETGLIRQGHIHGYCLDCSGITNEDGSIELNYHNESFRFIPYDIENVNIGFFTFTPEGAALMSVIMPEKAEGFYDVLLKHLSEQGKIL